MNATSSTIIQRVWNYCNVLRDDGVSYGDYLEQLTYLLFLKMDAENRSIGRKGAIPPKWQWETLRTLEGNDLENQYRDLLIALGKEPGLIGVIFRKAQSKIQDPAKLRRLIDLIDGETWMGLGVDVKGAIYEGLLEKNAQDTKSGAGQYFTPRPLIQAIVDVMQPGAKDTVADPACGTGGFLLAASDYAVGRQKPRDKRLLEHWRRDALRGWEIVDSAARLCVMNMYLHGIGTEEGDPSPITVADSLQSAPGAEFDMVLTNPPFGKKSSVTFVNEEGDAKRESQTITRNDFWTSTSNKQLNFVQHVFNLLKIGGRAAVVVPDNVLFEGGAGETIRRALLKTCDVHTLLRLPTGIFYAQGVKANVLFFDRKAASDKPWTDKLWIYDLRTNMEVTLKQNPLTRADLDDFVACYHPDNRHDRQPTWSETAPDGRWRCYTYDELAARDKVNLDIFWLRDESLEETSSLPEPDVLAAEIIEDLEAALEEFREIGEKLG